MFCKGPPTVCSEAELPREPDAMERVDAEPIDIQLVPGEAVADAAWIGVVVVMPALAKRQQGYPPVVGRIVAGSESGGCPRCARRN